MFLRLNRLSKVVSRSSAVGFTPARRFASEAAAGVAPEGSKASGKDTLGKLFFGSIVLGTACLGAWQSSRYFWKVQLLEERKATYEQPPLTLTPAAVAAGEADVNAVGVRRVSVTGVYDWDRAVRIGPRPAPKGLPERVAMAAGSAGGLIAVPMKLVAPAAPGPASASSGGVNNGGTVLAGGEGPEVLVVQGWWPSSQVKTVKDVPKPQTGVVTVSGVLREADAPGGWAIPHPAPHAGEFAWMDGEAMSAYLRKGAAIPSVQSSSSNDVGGAVQPVPLVEVVAVPPERPSPAMYPLARPPSTVLETHVMPSTHLTYAVTWFTLATLGVFMTARLFRKGRGGSGGGGRNFAPAPGSGADASASVTAAAEAAAAELAARPGVRSGRSRSR